MNFKLNEFYKHRHLHPELQLILDSLQEMYGERLIILSSDTKWIHFRVQGLPDELVARQLDARGDLFGETSHFQVLCPSDPTKHGLYLHHLSTPALRIDYKSGVRYF
jgi:hypothetical protein